MSKELFTLLEVLTKKIVKIKNCSLHLKTLRYTLEHDNASLIVLEKMHVYNIGKIIKLVLMMTALNIVSNDQLTHQMIHTCTEFFTEKNTRAKVVSQYMRLLKPIYMYLLMTRSDFNTSLDLYHLKMTVM